MISRRFPVGAEVTEEGTHFRIWAPDHDSAEVVLEPGSGPARRVRLAREPEGYLSALLRGVGHGELYRFRLDGHERLLADPASRFQPDGPLGPSMVVDPFRHHWTDRNWPGVALPGQVIYEMHVGTFTREGTWAAAAAVLPELAETGITLIELMPVGDFVGHFGWGYDVNCFYAPTRLYGTPDDFRDFVNRAHGLGMGVILDVVYNHPGPVGCTLPVFSSHYLSRRYSTDWGDAFNFDDEHSRAVREFFVSNVAYWTQEFHLDGFRLDATQALFDSSPSHIVRELASAARRAAGKRKVLVIAENEPQNSWLLRPVEKGGLGLDAMWNDDFHHTAMVAATGHNDGYYHDYLGSPQELISATLSGFLYQGQRYDWQKQRRGRPMQDIEPARLVNFLQNHDQVANSIRGERLDRLTSPGRLRALTALLLLAPGTPLLFQGQEFAASACFNYFCDTGAELAGDVRAGRLKFLSQFRALATSEAQSAVPLPSDPRTFESSKLDQSERHAHREALALHRDLLTLRRNDPVIRAQSSAGLRGAVLGAETLLLRFPDGAAGDRLLIVNLGRDLHLSPAPEPLLAPPEGARWATLWSSESVAYGGGGTAELDSDENWHVPGHAAVLLAPRPAEEPSRG